MKTSYKILIAAAVVTLAGFAIYEINRRKKLQPTGGKLVNMAEAIKDKMQDAADVVKDTVSDIIGSTPGDIKDKSGLPENDGVLVFMAAGNQVPIYAHITGQNVIYPMDMHSGLAMGVKPDWSNVIDKDQGFIDQFIIAEPLTNGTVLNIDETK